MQRFLVACALLAGCGGDDGTSSGPDAAGECAASGRYLPLTTGRTWTYKVTDTTAHTVSMKTQAVGARESIDTIHAGISAFKLTTTKPGGTTDSWQEDTGTEIRRHAENDNAGATTSTEHYDPYRIRVDETPAHTATGATWMQSYTEVVSTGGAAPVSTVKTETWSVIAADEKIDVPAGTFCTLHVHRSSVVGSVAGSVKDYWFAREVGKIKEAGDGQTEELSAYTR